MNVANPAPSSIPGQTGTTADGLVPTSGSDLATSSYIQAAGATGASAAATSFDSSDSSEADSGHGIAEAIASSNKGKDSSPLTTAQAEQLAKFNKLTNDQILKIFQSQDDAIKKIIAEAKKDSIRQRRFLLKMLIEELKNLQKLMMMLAAMGAHIPKAMIKRVKALEAAIAALKQGLPPEGAENAAGSSEGPALVSDSAGAELSGDSGGSDSGGGSLGGEVSADVGSLI